MRLYSPFSVGPGRKTPKTGFLTMRLILHWCIDFNLCIFYSDDKDNLSGRVQKLSTDLQLCREQIANKNMENLEVNDLKNEKKDNACTIQ